MRSEDLKSEIKLIFARSCVESLKETTSSILAVKDDSEKVPAAESHWAVFIVVSRYFKCETSLKRAPPAYTDQSSSTREAGSQPLATPADQF